MGPKRSPQLQEAAKNKNKVSGVLRNIGSKSAPVTISRVISSNNNISQANQSRKSNSPVRLNGYQVNDGRKFNSPVRGNSQNIINQNKRLISPMRNNIAGQQSRWSISPSRNQNHLTKRSNTPGRKQSQNPLIKTSNKTAVVQNRNPGMANKKQVTPSKERSRSVNKRNFEKEQHTSPTKTNVKIKPIHSPHLVALNKNTAKFNQEKIKLSSKSRNVFTSPEKDKISSKEDKKRTPIKDRNTSVSNPSNISPKTILKKSNQPMVGKQIKYKDDTKRLDAGDSNIKRFENVSKMLQEAIDEIKIEIPVKEPNNNLTIQTEINVISPHEKNKSDDDVCTCTDESSTSEKSEDEKFESGKDDMKKCSLEALNIKLLTPTSNNLFDQPNRSCYSPNAFSVLQNEDDDKEDSKRKYSDIIEKEIFDVVNKIKIQSNKFLAQENNESDKTNISKMISQNSIYLKDENIEDVRQKNIKESDSKLTIQSNSNMSAKTFSITEPYPFSHVKPSESNLTVQSFSNMSSKTFTISESQYDFPNISNFKQSLFNNIIHCNTNISNFGSSNVNEQLVNEPLLIQNKKSESNNIYKLDTKFNKQYESVSVCQPISQHKKVLLTFVNQNKHDSNNFLSLQPEPHIIPTSSIINNNIQKNDLRVSISTTEGYYSDDQNEEIIEPINLTGSNLLETNSLTNEMSNNSKNHSSQSKIKNAINTDELNQDKTNQTKSVSKFSSTEINTKEKNYFETINLILNDPLSIGPSSKLRQLYGPVKTKCKNNYKSKEKKDNITNLFNIEYPYMLQFGDNIGIENSMHKTNISTEQIEKGQSEIEAMTTTISFDDQYCYNDTAAFQQSEFNKNFHLFLPKKEKKEKNIFLESKLECGEEVTKCEINTAIIEGDKTITGNEIVTSLSDKQDGSKKLFPEIKEDQVVKERDVSLDLANENGNRETSLYQNESSKDSSGIVDDDEELYACFEDDEIVNKYSFAELSDDIIQFFGEDNEIQDEIKEENNSVYSMYEDKQLLERDIIESPTRENIKISSGDSSAVFDDLHTSRTESSLNSNEANLMEHTSFLTDDNVKISSEESSSIFDEEHMKQLNLKETDLMEQTLFSSGDNIKVSSGESSAIFDDEDIEQIESSLHLNETGTIEALKDRGESYEIEIISDDSDNFNWDFDINEENMQNNKQNKGNQDLEFNFNIDNDENDVAFESEEIKENNKIIDTPWKDYKFVVKDSNISNADIWLFEERSNCDGNEETVYENDWQITERSLEDLRTCLDKCKEELNLAEDDIKYVKRKSSKSRKYKKTFQNDRSTSDKNISDSGNPEFESLEVQLNPKSTMILDLESHCDLCGSSLDGFTKIEDDIDYYSVSSSDEINDIDIKTNEKCNKNYLSYGKSCKVKKKKKDFLSFFNFFKF